MTLRVGPSLCSTGRRNRLPIGAPLVKHPAPDGLGRPPVGFRPCYGHPTVELDQDTEVQPDIALLRPRDDFYAAEHPGPDDVLLIVEVADTLAIYDRSVKLSYLTDGGRAG